MGKFDPVSWETIETVLGAPAREVEEYVDELEETVRREENPYDAVKTIHDAIDDGDRSVPELGEVFITAYLLEKRGIVTPTDGECDRWSLVERRPDSDRLSELFWERERTLWWIGILAGVHPSLVSYWLYEDDIPLMERNLGAESLTRIRAYRDSADE